MYPLQSYDGHDIPDEFPWPPDEWDDQTRRQLRRRAFISMFRRDGSDPIVEAAEVHGTYIEFRLRFRKAQGGTLYAVARKNIQPGDVMYGKR